MSNTRIPVYLTHDEAETLVFLPFDYTGKECLDCRVEYVQDHGYPHYASCNLLFIGKAARKALPETLRRREYWMYLDTSLTLTCATASLLEAQRSGMPVEITRWYVDAVEHWTKAEADAKARYEETRDAELAKEKNETRP